MVPGVRPLLFAVLNVIVVPDCPEEVPVITEPLVGVAVAVYPVAPVTELNVTVVREEEEEEALTSVGAARGVMVTAGEEEDEVALVPVATTTIEYVVPGVRPLLFDVLNVTVVLDCPEEVPVITEPPLVGVAVAVYPVAPVTELNVTVVREEEEEEALTPVGASRGVIVTAGEEEDEVALVSVATTTIE